MLNRPLTIPSTGRERQQSAVTDYNLPYAITSAGSYSFFSFREFLSILMLPRAQFSVEPRGANPSQHLGQFRLRPHLRHGHLLLRVLGYHPCPPLHPPLCCAGTRPCSHSAPNPTQNGCKWLSKPDFVPPACKLRLDALRYGRGKSAPKRSTCVSRNPTIGR